MTAIDRSRFSSARVVALATAATLGAAAAAEADGRAMRFERLSVEQGLSHSSVLCLLQDSHGFLWLGTEAGLNRYDGESVHTYRHDVHDTSSLPSDFVWGLSEDPSGDLWVATEGGGLARWERARDRFVRLESGSQATPSLQVRTVLADRAGGLWVGTKDQGVAYRRADDESWRPVGDAATRRAGGYALYQDKGRIVWIGTNAGLGRYDTTDGSLRWYRHDPARPDSLADDRVRAVQQDREGRLWVGTFGGGLDLMRADGTFAHHRQDPARSDTLADDYVHSLLEDATGRLWIGTRGGLCRREPNGAFVRYRHDPRNPHTIGDDDVISLLEDRGHVLWVGTRAGGAARWNPRTWAFGHVAPDPANPLGLAAGYVTSFSEDRRGRLWVGTMGGGLHQVLNDAGHLRRYPAGELGPGDDRVMALMHDRSGRLWAGTMDAGVYRLDPGARRFVQLKHDPARPGSLSANGVTTLLEDASGAVWVGTYGGGLNLLQPGADAFRSYRHDPADPASISGDAVTALAQDAAGSLWVGTEGAGLNRLNPDRRRFQRFRRELANPGSLADDTVYALHVDAAGTVWAGTRSGLSRLERLDEASGRGLFRTYTAADGMAGNVVYGIEADGGGRLWLSGSQGLVRFDPNTGEFRQYVASHGLQGDEFNFGAHYRSARGELFFGGTRGFNRFLPDQLDASSSPPPVVLTRFLRFNRPAGELGPAWALRELRLGHRDAVVSFDFAALDFAAPERNRFAYRLEGFDRDWIDLGLERRVTFTNLDPGRYLLRVRAANSDGVWNEDGIALPLVVAPPPWLSWWAYLGYLALAAAVAGRVALAQRRKVALAADYRRRLEEEVQARTEELGRRNEELGRLNAQLVDTSLTDSLTGLRNRRYVFEEVGKELTLVQRQHRRLESGHHQDGAQLLFIMVDLDWFKPINDTCGHAAGDRVLVQVRDVLHGACRTSDVIVRWGGDEFLIVGRTADLDRVEVVPERVRAMIEQASFDLGDGQVAHLTATVGFTCYPGALSGAEGLTLEQVIALADRALYAAKKAGRNAWVGLLGNPLTDVRELLRNMQDEPDALLESGCVEVLRSDDPRPSSIAASAPPPAGAPEEDAS